MRKRRKDREETEDLPKERPNSSSGLSTKAKAAKLQEILDRVARREREDAERADEE